MDMRRLAVVMVMIAVVMVMMRIAGLQRIEIEIFKPGLFIEDRRQLSVGREMGLDLKINRMPNYCFS